MSNPFSLVKYDSEYSELLEQIELQGGEISEMQELMLDEITDKVVKAPAKYIETMSLFDEAETFVDSWLAKWATKKKQIERERDRWKKAMLQHCDNLQTTVLESEIGKVCIMQSEHVVTEINLPDEYMRTKIVKEPDKPKIKEDLKAGKDIPGAKLEVTRYPRIF